MGLALTDNTIDKYFKVLSKLDNVSKKKLILKLRESISKENFEDSDLKSMYGAWIDDKSSDEIIKEIRDSRINKHEIEEF